MEIPMPTITPLNEPLWSRLREGELVFQRCTACGNAWLPPREECPVCLEARWEYEPSTGSARLISWVVFHRAHHPFFEDKLPYNVSLVELDEGPGC